MKDNGELIFIKRGDTFKRYTHTQVGCRDKLMPAERVSKIGNAEP